MKSASERTTQPPEERGEYLDLQLLEDALFMAVAVDANVERGERMRELGERIYRLKRPAAAELPRPEPTASPYPPRVGKNKLPTM